MKKYFYLCAIMLLSATVFTSCSDDDENEVGFPNDLIGTWQLVSHEGWEKCNGEIKYQWSEDADDLAYVFTEDGEVRFYEYYSGKWNLEERGEYIYKNGKIIINVEEVVYDVKELTSSTLVLVGTDMWVEREEIWEGYYEDTFCKVDDLDLK